MLRYANPARFMRASGAALPWLAWATGAVLVMGLVLSFRAPPDYQQGKTVLIMFIHVPAAWMAMFVYTTMALSSGTALIWRHPLAEIAAQQSAALGAGFTALCLITGSLWGAPMWGTWWVWDARLTSVLVLFFLYLGYLALLHAFDQPERGAKAAAVLALVGWINIPIIKFSVDWWNSLHQPASVLRLDGPSMPASFLVPLLVMALGFTLLHTVLLTLRMRTALMRRKIEAFRLAEVEAVAEAYPSRAQGVLS
jgi:heme exporter protein C